MNITLRQLRYFLALADEANFTRAAELMHVTQPALSMQIKALEDALGASLVERTSAGVVLTPQGRALQRHAARVMAAMADLDQGMRVSGQGGRLMIGMIPTVAPYLLPQVLPVLRASDIGRDLHLREAQTERLIEELLTGKLDVAVVATPPQTTDLVAQLLFSDRFLLAGSGSRIQQLDRRAITPRDLDPGQLLLLDEGHCLGDQALDVCGLSRGNARLDLGAASLSTLCRLAAQGMGYTFLPELALKQELAAAPGLQAIRFPEPQPFRNLVLMRRTSTPSGGWFDDLAETLRQGARAAIGA